MLFTATYVAADSSNLGPATGVTWTSSDTSVASMQPDGHFQARCTGRTTIAANVVVGARNLRGQRIVSVNTIGPRCAALSIAMLNSRGQR
jgi:hypothetical protein